MRFDSDEDVLSVDLSYLETHKTGTLNERVEFLKFELNRHV